MQLFESVLITGCRFEIGQGLCRILKESGLAGTVIGSDFMTDHPATLIFDQFERTTHPDHPDYFNSIRRVVNNHGVDLIVPMSEAEIYLFTEKGYFNSFDGIPLLTADQKSISVGKDKLATVEFLALHGIPYPWTLIVGEHAPREVPCVIKPRGGNESVNVLIVDEPELVPILRRKRPDDIWQELLLPKVEEYTCGLYRSASAGTRSIIMRRRLQGGYTSAGEVIVNEGVSDYLVRIAEALDLRGSVNVQLKLTDRGPVAFEINPRFSSTVMFRHLLGFQDLIWSMKDLKGLSPGCYEPVEEGVRFYRGAREFIIPG